MIILKYLCFIDHSIESSIWHGLVVSKGVSYVWFQSRIHIVCWASVVLKSMWFGVNRWSLIIFKVIVTCQSRKNIYFISTYMIPSFSMWITHSPCFFRYQVYSFLISLFTILLSLQYGNQKLNCSIYSFISPWGYKICVLVYYLSWQVHYFCALFNNLKFNLFLPLNIQCTCKNSFQNFKWFIYHELIRSLWTKCTCMYILN